MNTTHLHLLITHLPVFGTALGLIVLLFSLRKQESSALLAAYSIFLVSALGATIAYFTGEPAEETLKTLGLSNENVIESHEESAELTILLMGFLGFLSLIALLPLVKNAAFQRSIRIVIMVSAVIGLIAVSRTAYLGGQIRHTEINQNSVSSAGASDTEQEDNHGDD